MNIQKDVEKIVSGVHIKTALADVSSEFLYMVENKNAFIPGAIEAVITPLLTWSREREKKLVENINVINGCKMRDKRAIIETLEKLL